MSIAPFFITESRANSDQKFGTGLNIYLRLPNWSKKANIGRINTVPPILKIAKACTLFVANELTSRAETGVNNAKSKATGMYAV